MVDQDIIATRLNQLLRSVRRLERISALPKDVYLRSEDDRDLAEHHLRRALEACLDTGNHIIASEALGKPQRMRDIPILLGEKGIISPALAGKLADAATLRNRLVHGYVTIDHDIIFHILQHDLEDMQAFAVAISAYCDAHE